MDIFLLIAWGICGIINLICGNISRLSYGLMWVAYMCCLLVRVIA